MDREDSTNTTRKDKTSETSEDDIMKRLEDPKTVDKDDPALWTEVNDPKEVESFWAIRT